MSRIRDVVEIMFNGDFRLKASFIIN